MVMLISLEKGMNSRWVALGQLDGIRARVRVPTVCCLDFGEE